jgi:hypothetical protein
LRPLVTTRPSAAGWRRTIIDLFLMGIQDETQLLDLVAYVT